MGKSFLDLNALNSSYDVSLFVDKASRKIEVKIRLEKIGRPIKFSRDFSEYSFLDDLPWQKFKFRGRESTIGARYSRKGVSEYVDSRGAFAPTRIGQMFDLFITSPDYIRD